MTNSPQNKPRGAGRRGFFAAKPLANVAFRRLLYLIELDPRAALDPAFMAANPNYVAGILFYVGSTSLTPQERFEQHITGSKNASRIAHSYGIKLRMDLVPNNKSLPRDWAIRAEARLARDLRSKGFGAWQA
ncbi:MAG: hypothetical protein H7Y36_07350 [Armatimonadetes bacterium]|nr:hypothetical protein [Akkermansiaceae bacterium]